MSKNRTLIIAVILGLLFAGGVGIVLSILSNNTAQPKTSSSVTLSMVGYSKSAIEMQPIIQAYEHLYPHVSISYTQVDQSTYRSYIINNFHAQNSLAKPDIFEAENGDQNAFLKYSYVAPQSILTAKTFKEAYYPIYDRGLLYNSKYVLGIPEDLHPMLLLYNMTLLEELGINPTTFTSSVVNFNTYINTVEKQNSSLIPANIGVNDTISNAGDILQLLMLSNETAMNDASDNTKTTFNSIEGVQALEYFTTFINGVHNDNVGNLKQSDITSFADGKLLTLFAYPDQLTTIKQLAPTMNIGYSLFPSVSTPVDLAYYNYFAVASSSQNPTQAWQFLAFLSQKPQTLSLLQQQQTQNLYSAVSPRKDLQLDYADTSFSSVIKTASNDASDWNFDGNDYTNTLFKNIVINVLNGVSAQATLDQATTIMNSHIQKAKEL